MSKVIVSVFDSKSYDREHLAHALEKADSRDCLELRFLDCRLTAATAAAAAGSQAVCVFVSDEVDHETLTVLNRIGVRFVALRCTGFNNVDLQAARGLSVAVTRVAIYSPHAVAEHAVALLMTLNRKTHRAYNRVREQNFGLQGLVGFDLHGKTAGIFGTGKIGRITAEILRGFGMRVIACDPSPDTVWAETVGAEYVPFEQILTLSDVVSLHVPLLPQTIHVMNRSSLAKMKPGAFLINVSRGKLVDTGALIESLKSGRLGGVALDVYEEEEGVFFQDLSGQVLQDDELARLITFPNVIVTAHQAFLTREALDEISRVTIGNLLAFAQGKPFLEGTELT